MSIMDFNEKKILVTGASSGIGRSTAIRLSELGAKLVILGRNKDRLDKTLGELTGDGHIAIQFDFVKSSIEDYIEIFEKAIGDGVKLDGLVHCAGVATILPLKMINKDKLDECMQINFYSFIELVKQFSRKKYHNIDSSIVGISSIATKCPAKCQTVYVASKAAINAVVPCLAMELVDKGIRINSVMPASTDTPMLRESYEREPGDKTEGLKMQILGMSQPEDIADVIIFLLSDMSRTITGRAIYADGGLL